MDSENVVATATQRKNIGPNGSTSNNSVGRNNTTALNGGSSNKNGVRRDEQNGGSNAWASTSAFRQNSGPSSRQPRQLSNRIGDRRSACASSDYWHKNNSDGPSHSSTGGEQPQHQQQSRNNAEGGNISNDRNQRSHYYRNDRWPRTHHPNAPPPLTSAQRRAKGPLPDWDEVQELGAEDGFDYMELMENVYILLPLYLYQ